MQASATNFPEAFSLRGETIMITGGATGIGQAIAHSMHAAGAHVVLVGRREAELAAAVTAMGERSAYYVFDVTRLEAACEIVTRIEREQGAITCLVNNAGIHLKKPAVETSSEEFEQVMRTHVFGAHALVRAVAPGMMARKHGTILFTASMASLFGIPLVIAYTAAKTAMVGMVKGYATEFSPHGITVNAIAPGWIETEMSRKAMEGDPARKSKILGRTPAAKFGLPEDIGWAAVYLASPAARFVTGVTLPVDGGASVGF
ncbi:SDR family NAD(P)-dependent oxidoreductase [Opitutales bacterium ASA1]|uniref:SDR family NAD(P)-dependent oxidoreductase n=1 Tax=Congregicoccus parvus TaxID=3081749 RepID=UPI002B31BAE5|nr:SDR family NAD(P)-dependent oxidoreductase [Opitutales bacterium ASA1]